MAQNIKTINSNNQILIILFGSIVFLLPVMWNGFPFVFTDSLSYITSGMDLLAPPDRPIFYGLLIRATGVPIKIWGVVIFQAILLSYFLLVFSNALFPKIHEKYLYLWILIITTLTSLPWFVGQISPDIFSSILYLALIVYALTYKHISDLNAFFIAAVIILSICVHSANLIIGAITFMAIIFWFLINRHSWRDWKKYFVVVSMSFFSAVVFIIISNIWSHYGVTLNPTSKVFVLARVIEDGPGLKYLRSICKNTELKTCASLPLLEQAKAVEIQNPNSKDPELKNLVASAFLWGGGLSASGGIFVVNAEAGSIIKESIKTYPLEELAALIRNMGNQLITFSVGEQLNSTLKLDLMNQFFSSKFPSLYSSYLNSNQSLEKLRAITQFLNPIYFYVVIFSLILVFNSCILFSRRNFPSDNLFLAVYGLLFFLAANALVTGGLSGVFDRYQSRVIWLLPAISILLLIGLFNLSKSSDNDADTVNTYI